MVLAICVWATHHALGKHANEIDPKILTAVKKGYMAAIICFDFGLVFAKLSALAFYVRIFGWLNSPHRKWKFAVLVGVFLVVTHPMIDVTNTITTCNPVAKFWDGSIPGSCSNERHPPSRKPQPGATTSSRPSSGRTQTLRHFYATLPPSRARLTNAGLPQPSQSALCITSFMR